MTLFYPAQMSAGTFIHLLAVHIAVLLFILLFFFFFCSCLFMSRSVRVIYLPKTAPETVAQINICCKVWSIERKYCVSRKTYTKFKSHRHSLVSCNWSTECIFKNRQSLGKKISEIKLARQYKLIWLPFKCQKMFRDSRTSDVKSNMKGK